MRFSQKLVTTMLLVIAAFFSVGGGVLVNGSFSDRMESAGQQEQEIHAMLCGMVEDRYLTANGQGETIDNAFWQDAGSRVAANGGAQSMALSRNEECLYAIGADLPLTGIQTAETALTSGSSMLRRSGSRVIRYYRSALLGGITLDSAFDVTEIYNARDKSLRRFLVLEGAVILGAAAVIWLISRRLTRPLALLTAASTRMAAGDYALRTNIQTGDEIGLLSEAFDKMAQAVQEKIAALELSVRQRDDFVGAFTHELKTPMTGIIGYSDLLRSMQPDPDEQRQAAGAIFREARRLESLSGKLLQLMGLDDTPVECVPVPLETVLRAAVQAAEPARNGCTIETDAAGTVLCGDADLYTDLFLNLLTNAARACHDGQVIRAVCTSVSEDQAVIEVQDHGCGIPADQLERVTEPFYMVDKSRSRRQGGSGLGLTLCRRIAETFGGSLVIHSTVGQGTTVVVTLPLARKEADQ